MQMGVCFRIKKEFNFWNNRPIFKVTHSQTLHLLVQERQLLNHYSKLVLYLHFERTITLYKKRKLIYFLDNIWSEQMADNCRHVDYLVFVAVYYKVFVVNFNAIIQYSSANILRKVSSPRKLLVFV